MKLRDHIADLISGGALTRAIDWRNKSIFDASALIVDLRRKLEAAESASKNALDENWRLTCVLGEIHDHCAKLKSGTAKRITRICKEALDE